MTKTKRDLVLAVSERNGMTQTDVLRVIDDALDLLCNELVEGHRWELRGFGVLETKQRAGRTARNPRTGETVEVAPRQVVAFKPSQVLAGQVAAKQG